MRYGRKTIATRVFSFTQGNSTKLKSTAIMETVKFLSSLGSLTGLAALTVTVLFATSYAQPSDKVVTLSTDKQMQEYFFAHQGDFETLKNVALKDPSPNMIIGLKSSYADPYRTLMERIGATLIFNGKTKGIGVASELWGDPSKNICLAYKWMPKPPSEHEMVKNVDDLMKGDPPFAQNGDVYIRYKLLTGHWYIIFQWPAKSSNS